jgi:membrane protease YdiL (CAAX protease family)
VLDARRLQPGGRRAVQYAWVALAVGLYSALGFVFNLDTNTYLLVGIPITVLFQLFVARRPLQQLWLNHGQAFVFDRWTVAWWLLLVIGPIMTISDGVRAQVWPVVIYGVVAIGGAMGAAFALRVLDMAHLRLLGLLTLMLIPIGLVRALTQGADAELGARAVEAIKSLLFYVPAVFVVEEVFFRGALDSYLHRDEKETGWASAAFVSVLWGLWHAPIVGALSLPVVVSLVVVQLALGLVLSWYWRKTGNLAVPGTMHALLDALRNAIQL